MYYKALLLGLLMQSAVSAQQLPAPHTALSQAQEQTPTDIYLLIGQSNMAGRGAVDSLSKQASPSVLMFDRSNHWAPATDPLHFDKKEAGVGPGLSFAQTMAAASTNSIIGLIPCAVGGTSISKWQPGAYDEATKTHPYDDAIKRAKLALQSGKLKGILWHQGEGDSGGDRYQQYQQRFDSLLTNLARDLGIDINRVPIVIGQLGPFFVTKYPGSHAQQMNEVLQQIAAAHTNIVCVSSEGLTDKGDRTHFDTKSARELGKRYAAAMLQLQHRK